MSAYSKHSWLPRLGTGLNRFKDQNDDYIYLTSEPKSVSQVGTPFSATWMNEIEDGIYNAGQKTLIAKSITTTWTGSVAPYTQDIAVTGLTTADIVIIGTSLTGVYADDMDILTAWSQISRIKINAGSITVYGNSATDIAIPIRMLVVSGGNTVGVDAFLCGQGNTLKKKLITKILTVNTVWTAPSNMVGGSVNVHLFGGGGAGGGVTSGGGGAGGHRATGVFSLEPGDVVPVTVGVGGAYSSTNNGGTGGVTSFGVLLSANGGGGGLTTAKGGGGGTGGGGGALSNTSFVAGGTGAYGGGGGGGGSSIASTQGSRGGPGGTFGGGGGGGVASGGGAAGGTGTGAGGSRNKNGFAGTNTTATDNEFKGTGAGGLKGTAYGGGGGGGIGGVGGNCSTTGGNASTSTAGGGGGGYGAPGGNGGTTIYSGGGGGGGGGGYGGAGLNGNASGGLTGGGGGGGGYGANNYGKGSNGASGVSGSDGVCIISYFVLEL